MKNPVIGPPNPTTACELSIFQPDISLLGQIIAAGRDDQSKNNIMSGTFPR
jgi:hypothetical protein